MVVSKSSESARYNVCEDKYYVPINHHVFDFPKRIETPD